MGLYGRRQELHALATVSRLLPRLDRQHHTHRQRRLRQIVGALALLGATTSGSRSGAASHDRIGKNAADKMADDRGFDVNG